MNFQLELLFSLLEFGVYRGTTEWWNLVESLTEWKIFCGFSKIEKINYRRSYYSR